MKYRIIILAAALALLGSAAFATEPFVDLKANLEKNLRIELESCPQGMLGPTAVDYVQWCGNYRGEPKSFRRLWNRAVNRIRSFQPDPDSGWESMGNGLRRSRFLRHELQGIVLHYTEQGVIVIGLDKGPISCLEAGLEGRGDSGRFTNENTPGATKPKNINHVSPGYPLRARERRLSGNVVLELIVTEEGGVRDICVADATPESGGFSQAAVKAVQQWRYTPGTLNGEPAAFYVQVTVSFSLH